VLLAYGLRRKSSRDFDRPSPDRPYAQKAIGLTVLVPKSIFVFPIDQAAGPWCRTSNTSIISSLHLGLQSAPHRYLQHSAVTLPCHIDEVWISPELFVIAGQQILLAFIEAEPKHGLA